MGVSFVRLDSPKVVLLLVSLGKKWKHGSSASRKNDHPPKPQSLGGAIYAVCYSGPQPSLQSPHGKLSKVADSNSALARLGSVGHGETGEVRAKCEERVRRAITEAEGCFEMGREKADYAVVCFQQRIALKSSQSVALPGVPLGYPWR